MSDIFDVLGYIIISVGLAFDLFGCVGLVRMPNVYTRLQAATKCVTLGTCSILFGVFCITGGSPTGIKALICLAFVAVTSPTTAHAIARGSHKFGVHVHKGAVVDKYDEEVDHHEEGETL
jgi:multicomponent Na+:H+ antiporter subunit G